MISLKNFFWLLIFVCIFMVSYQIAPIYYKGYGIRGICQSQADVYHKYGKGYVSKRLDEHLTRLGIPPGNRDHNIKETEDAVVIEITYRDTANFLDRYTRDFTFTHRCEGVLRAVW